MATLHHALWTDGLPLNARRGQSTIPPATDIVVVGAGISGLTTAVLLARAGKKVAVLEMHPEIGAGATGITTAHITQLHDTGFSEIVKDFGPEQARLTAAGLGAATDTIEMLVRECSIACDFKRTPAYLYAATADANGDVESEFDGLRQAGIYAERIDSPGLPFATGAALRVDNQAQFQPLAYLIGLKKEIEAHGGVVCTDVRFKSVNEHDDHVIITTAAGDIRAEQVVFATHTPPNKFTLQLKLTPQMSYVLALRCGGTFPEGLFYDTEEPYHYLRRHPHPDGDLIIVGGADHRTGDLTETEEAYASLERYARERLDVREVVYRWSGMYFEPTDGLPFIGLNPGTRATWVITGLSGTGMTAGTLGAIICAEGILGTPSRFAPVFTPSRIKPIAAAAEFAKHNVAVGSHMVADRVKAWLTQEPLKANEGKIMRHEGHTAAVYNDGATVHAMSPVCPHAGCYVQFNNAEKTWDCPCHGSRFGCTGKLMTGPATSDLAPLE